MAKRTTSNQTKTGDVYAGRYFFLLKELAVSAGWTVKGSGDGGTRFGYRGGTSVPAPERGSGGEFDCWRTGTGGRHGDGLVAGDPRHGSWLVLENDGRELLLVPSAASTSNWDGYGRMFYAPKGSGGFVSSGADATTLPAAAPDEVALFGARGAPNGVDIFVYNEDGFVQLWADDAPENGALALGFQCVDAVGAPEGFFCIAPIIAATTHPSDPDSVVVMATTTGPQLSTGNHAWNYGLGEMQSVNLTAAAQGFWGGQGVLDPVSGGNPVDTIPVLLGTGGNRVTKGHLSAKGILWAAAPHAYPLVTSDGYLYTTAGFLVPWEAPETVPRP